jgi:hypothetical protein
MSLPEAIGDRAVDVGEKAEKIIDRDMFPR